MISGVSRMAHGIYTVTTYNAGTGIFDYTEDKMMMDDDKMMMMESNVPDIVQVGLMR
jgi:hypothetical protein